VLSRKKGLVIPVPSHFIENKTVLLHRLHNCEVYLVGVISNLVISKCKNCTIFAGSVAEQVVVKSCSKTNITACCSRIIFSDEEQPLFQPGGNTAFVSTLGRPVVEFYAGAEQAPVNFAPCNFWYKGMLSDLNHIGHILSPNTNRFNQTYQISPYYLNRQTSSDTLIETDSRDNVNLLSLEQFCINEIPFDVVEIGDDRIEEDLPQMRSEEALILRAALPSPYKEWIEKSDALKVKVRNLFKQASTKDENFMNNITKKFDAWLEDSNQIHSVNALYKSARS
jgi:Tubulin binding cofactor C